MTRRDLLKTSGLFTAASYNRIWGANERLNVGFIGTGIMGRGNLWACMSQKNVRVTSLCDVYDTNLVKAMIQSKTSKPLKDFRYVLTDKETDAVCISTPDHWHAYMTVEAFKSGKHVYCEKPIAHSFTEIPAMIKARNKYNKVFQSGQWQRSSLNFREATAAVQNGDIGKVFKVGTWLFGYDPRISKYPDGLPPQGLDAWGWDMWLGPAQSRSFNWNRFTTNPTDDPKRESFSWFRFFWDYANGMMGDWGPHLLDIAFWGVGENNNLDIESIGRKSDQCNTDNASETPNFWPASFGYNSFTPVEFFHDGCNYSAPKGKDHGIEFIGGNGKVFVNRHKFQLLSSDDKVIKESKPTNDGHRDHWTDFIGAIRLNGDTRAGLNEIAYGNAACLLAAAVQRSFENNGPSKLNWQHNKDLTKNKVTGINRRYLDYSYRKPWKLEI